MGDITTDTAQPERSGHRDAVQIRDALRELSIQLSLLNHQVSTRIELRDFDFDCLDLIKRHGPISPTALSRRAGLHPATMTSVLDRLERGRWIIRERDPADRRAVKVKELRDRNAELYRIYTPMNKGMDVLCSEYDGDQLQMIADFLRKTTEIGRSTTERLSRG